MAETKNDKGEEKIFSLSDVKTILDAYQVECQKKYNTGTVPDAQEWFAGKFNLLF